MNHPLAAAPPRQQLAGLVDAIEAEMRLLCLWEQQAPSLEDMASRLPFCYDTLKFWQWLQWIFVPRIRLILADGSPLPANSDIAPLAETEFRGLQQDCSRLLALIRAFDQLITQQR